MKRNTANCKSINEFAPTFCENETMLIQVLNAILQAVRSLTNFFNY